MLTKLLFMIQPTFLEVDWAGIWHDARYFILGFMTGIVLLMLVITFFFLQEKEKTKHRLSQAIALDDKVLLDMIESKQNQLDKTVRITDNGYFRVAIDLSFELTEEIARYYFPESKYPIYELSIQEMLNLNFYITKRIEELVNGKFFKLFKNTRVASIIDLLNTRKKINNSKLMQVTRKLKLQQIYSATRTVLNYANPIYWFRKLAIKPTTVLVTKEICKYIINIFGEETNKIYSKAIFKEGESEEDLIKMIDEFVDEEEV